MKDRIVILHAHMFKNAGTTLDWSLERNFQKSFVDHRDDQAMRSGGADYLKTFIDDNHNVVALSSHSLPMDFSKSAGIKHFPLVLLRHPILRIKSVYDFERRQNASTPGAINAKKMNFKEYVSWRMEPSSAATIRDFQTRYCGNGLNYLVKTLDELYQSAAEFLKEQALVGIVEKYDESMIYFEHELKSYFSQLDLSYIKQNVTGAKTKVGLEEKLAQIKEQLGDDLTKLVYAENQNDLNLYQLAQEILNEKTAKIPGHSQKLSELRQRNQKLQQTGSS